MYKNCFKRIIDFFNAVNGRWLLRLISSKKALDSTFSREKMSIISAVKFAMAYYTHDNIVWVPVSLEELLRVSGNTGLSQNNGLLSAKNLSFDHGATCDDLLLIGIEKSEQGIYVHLLLNLFVFFVVFNENFFGLLFFYHNH